MASTCQLNFQKYVTMKWIIKSLVRGVQRFTRVLPYSSNNTPIPVEENQIRFVKENTSLYLTKTLSNSIVV